MQGAVIHKGLDEEERELFRRFSEEEDLDARDELFFRYDNLLAFFAHRYSSNRYPYKEAYQIAAVGLLKAMRRFDPEKGTAFSTFAYPTIDGELKRFYRDHAENIRLPRHVYELKNSLKSLERDDPGRGERMRVGELAGLLECTEKEMVEALAVTDGVLTISLDRGLLPEADGSSPTLGQRLGEECEDLADMELRVILEGAMTGLTARERFILERHFFEGRTQTMIAGNLGVSQMQVSRIMRRALDKIKDNLGPDPFTSPPALTRGEHHR
jgi:RNA polymerase sigma-B factor